MYSYMSENNIGNSAILADIPHSSIARVVSLPRARPMLNAHLDDGGVVAVAKIAAIINAHREGTIAIPSLKSYISAKDHAERHGHDVELICVLDRADASTVKIFNNTKFHFDHVIETSYGDLGLARNAAVQAAKSEILAFLDADDLWSENWLTSLAAAVGQTKGQAILHCHYNVFFGGRQEVFVHPDSDDPEFDIVGLAYQNFWTALSGGPAEIYRKVAYEKVDWVNGFGYEDWTWNCHVLDAGFVHKRVPETIHFIRSKRGHSLLQSLSKEGVCRMPTATLQNIVKSQA